MQREASTTSRSPLLWKGLLRDAGAPVRMLAFVTLAVAVVSLVFTQLGFVTFNGGSIYAVSFFLMMAPMTICAVILGVWPSTALGAISGLALCIHANLQALSYYEYYFYTTWLTILFFTLLGFALGIGFALIYKGFRRSRGKYVLAAVVSVLEAALLEFFALTQMLLIVGAGLDASAQEAMSVIGAIWPSILFQIAMNGALVFVSAVIALAGCRQRAANLDRRRLALTFNSWLFMVVLISFMTVAGVSFYVITEQAGESADELIDSEVGYITNQLQKISQREAELSLVYGEYPADSIVQGEIEDIVGVVSDLDHILEGYNADFDGSIVVFRDGVVAISDDRVSYPNGIAMEEALGPSIMESLPEILGLDESFITTIDHDYGEQEELLNILVPDYAELGFMRISQSGEYTVMMMLPQSKVFEGRTSTMIWTTLSSLILLLAIFFMASWLLRRNVIDPIDETNSVLSKITSGDLGESVPESRMGSWEFRQLGSGINTTVDALKDWIAEAENRIDQELLTARTIQESALPRIFPPFPDIWAFDLYASMNPAREVGGDFYDFFLIGPDDGIAEGPAGEKSGGDDPTGTESETTDPDGGSDSNSTVPGYVGQGRLGIVLADVSGKGIPAALYMMRARTALRGYMETGMPVSEAVENANHVLCEGNEAGMFVTAFAGVLDYTTGSFEYVNAGHNPPLLWKEGSWRWLREVSGLPLGLFDGMPYTAVHESMVIGDEILVYTDGVTEAMDADGAQFGEARLEALLEANFYLHPRQLIEKVREEVEDFAGEAEQSDDITMLALEYGVPPELTATLKVRADVDELPHVLGFIHTELGHRMCPLKVQKQIDLAVEELFVNIANYAYPGSEGDAVVSYTYTSDPPTVTIEIADEGVEFDPFSKPDAVTPDNIMDVQIGGFGILMVKNNVDEYSYERTGSMNVVTIKKSWK